MAMRPTVYVVMPFGVYKQEIEFSYEIPQFRLAYTITPTLEFSVGAFVSYNC
jgi:hypothetical protein